MENACGISAEAPIHFNPEGNYGVGVLGSVVLLIDGMKKSLQQSAVNFPHLAAAQRVLLDAARKSFNAFLMHPMKEYKMEN